VYVVNAAAEMLSHDVTYSSSIRHGIDCTWLSVADQQGDQSNNRPKAPHQFTGRVGGVCAPHQVTGQVGDAHAPCMCLHQVRDKQESKRACLEDLANLTEHFNATRAGEVQCMLKGHHVCRNTDCCSHFCTLISGHA
jgi:hypothetical protein